MTSEKAYAVAANPFLLGILLIRAGIEINPGPYDSLIREFVLAAADGNLAAIRILLRRNPSLATKKAQNFNSALYAAAYNGHTTVVKELWKHGADIDEKGPDRTPPSSYSQGVYSHSGVSDQTGSLTSKQGWAHSPYGGC